MKFWNVPTYPGAMTPAQFARQIVNGLFAVLLTATATAILCAALILFN